MHFTAQIFRYLARSISTMKNSYILLRNNKETGPYSLNELQNHGLKPDDLVWVEGQSVAWLHPGEIPDLKAQATHSTEKPVQVIENPMYEVAETKEEIPILTQQTETNRKSVFVSMPVNKMMKKDDGEKKILAFSSIGKQEENPVAETKYSQPLDEIKEMYVKTLQQRKQKIARKNSLRKQLKSGSLIVGLLALGVLVGLTLKKGTGKKPAVTAIEQQQPPVQNNSVPETISINPDQLISQPQTEKILTNQQPGNLLQEEIKKQQSENENTSLTTKRNVAAKKEITPVENTDGAGATGINGERTSKVRSDAGEVTKAPVENISSKVFIRSNNYKTGSFGGIKDLQLTVANDSKYILDNVIVRLQYLKPDGEIVKEENIQFKSVSPNGTQTILVAKTNRGVKVSYKITKIESKEIGGSVAGL